jgi:hypothetical protein
MKFLDTSLRMRHDRTFFNFANRFPDSRMALWCMNSNEMMSVLAHSPDHVHRRLDQLPDILSFPAGPS